jgi:hypothetical protein
MSCGFGGHTAYEIFRDLGGFIGSIIALIAAALAYRVRIPTQSGRGFRFDVGHRSDLIPATIPK